MGWLDCNPDELFLPTRFTVRDLPYYTPGPVENFLIGLSHITPDAVMRALDGPLSVSFIARPMQVKQLACCHAPAYAYGEKWIVIDSKR